MITSIEEGRREDGNRSIADKIIKRLHDLDKMVENNQGRWAWELLQNAKDSIAEEDDRTVSIQIEFNDDNIEFRHNGTHFTEKDIRGLINQISSKEVDEGEKTKKTGKFGTGFLTTHLLSKTINVRGIVETINNEFYSFEFPLDRDGKTTALLVPKIENSWTKFHNSAKKIKSDYDKNNFNTAFNYSLKTEDQIEIARIGIEEFSKLIPFVLAFIPKIEKVEIIDNVTQNNTVFEYAKGNDSDLIVTVVKTENDEEENILILYSSNEGVTIATEVEQSQKGYVVKSLQSVPKLFCDFPLIGTEDFYFPVVINSFYFNPQTERDGVWLKGSDDEVEENQDIIEKAKELFIELIEKIEKLDFFNLYNLAETRIPLTNEKYFDSQWYKNSIQTPIRDCIFSAKIVELVDDTLFKQAVKDVWFPAKSYNEAERSNLWQFTFDLVPTAVCKQDHLNYWCEAAWDEWKKLTCSVILKTLSNSKNIGELATALKKDIAETYIWLNKLGDFYFKDEINILLFDKFAAIPNRNNTFKLKSELFLDEINDEDLIEILSLLGDDWKEILVNDAVEFGSYFVKKKEEIALKISDKLKKPTETEETRKAISLISEWFENNKDIGKELFSELYRKKAELFMNTISDKESLYKVMRSNTNLAELSKVAQALSDNPELIESIKRGEELSSLLKEFDISDVSELKSILLRNGRFESKIEITQDILASLGVTSLEELEAALEDKDFAALFTHTSKPNSAMFLYAQRLISRAKDNIIAHLMTLPDYDCSEIEELATTVLGGIKKDGLAIHVVVRPSDNHEVIVYYSSEKDTLDYANAELWIDNGSEEPKLLTLGKILKNTGINKIPV